MTTECAGRARSGSSRAANDSPVRITDAGLISSGEKRDGTSTVQDQGGFPFIRRSLTVAGDAVIEGTTSLNRAGLPVRPFLTESIGAHGLLAIEKCLVNDLAGDGHLPDPKRARAMLGMPVAAGT